MSLDDLRDYYKSSRQSSDVKLKLNGATYRKLRGEYNNVKFGNTIAVRCEGIYRGELDALNDKYNLQFLDLRQPMYSLNKKKRWELSKDLAGGMSGFASDDIDVRLYETRNRNEKKSNCIAVHKSKGEPIDVKKTFANLQSIKRAQELQTIAKNTKFPKEESSTSSKTVHVSKKNRKCSKPGLNQKNSNGSNEVIVVDVDESDEEDVSYVQYEVEYAPKSDVLKYGLRRYKNENHVNKTSKPTKFFHSMAESDLDISEDDEKTENETRSKQTALNVGLEDLIDQHLVKIAEKNSLKEIKNQQQWLEPSTEKLEMEKKDKKVYVEKSDESSEEGEKSSKSFNSRKSAKPIPINLSISNQGIDSKSLKATFDLKYAEAYLCWPRMFSINLDKELRKRLHKHRINNKDFDIVMWLRFEQTTKSVENDASEFKVSILTNLECESIALENINPFGVYTLSTVVEKSLEFMLTIPIDLYRLKDMNKSWSDTKNKSNIIYDLPNIGGDRNVKTLDEIKLELVQTSLEKLKLTTNNVTAAAAAVATTTTSSSAAVNRSNSIEVVKHDEVVDVFDEKRVEARLDMIFRVRSFECMLCFDTHTNLDDCVVIRPCAHCVCGACMRAYIDSHLFNSHLNAGSLPCPACDTHLELALMINYASDANFMEIFIRHTIERVVFVLNEYKWCPSPFCGKIIQVDLNSNPFGTVSCTCGFKMCLRCNNAPHFPAKCSQVANYYKELNINNDFSTPDDRETYSLGKRCPLCSTFIEKNGGCNHMYCVTCKKYFCWNCLMDWDTHSQQGYKCKPVTFGQVRVEFRKERKPIRQKHNNVRYEDSLIHRQKRTYKTKRALVAHAKRIIDTLVQFDKYNFVIANQDELDKTKKYLSSLIEFLNEMHFVCEHAYVLISDNSLSRDTVNCIRNLIYSIETNIWLIETMFENGSGPIAIEELKRRHEKGLRCLKLLKAIKID